ncbi:MAG: DUF47 family protein [Thermoanaerobaculia bacterium]
MWKFLMPKTFNFFAFFVDAAEKIKEGAKELDLLYDNFDKLKEKVERIKELEHECDRITHETLEHLNRTFVCPFDREDIHSLITKMDNILDFIDAAAQRTYLYKIEKPTEEGRKLVKILVSSVDKVLEAVKNLKNFKKPKVILELCVEINTLENEGDVALRQGLATLLESQRDPIDILKRKEIYENLENAIDSCEDVANVMEAIILKNT